MRVVVAAGSQKAVHDSMLITQAVYTVQSLCDEHAVMQTALCPIAQLARRRKRLRFSAGHNGSLLRRQPRAHTWQLLDCNKGVLMM